MTLQVFSRPKGSVCPSLIASAALFSLLATATEPVTAGYDILPGSGSGVFTGGVVFDLEVRENRHLVIESFEFQVRAGQSSVWDYTLYFREGSLVDQVAGLPAHRVEAAWQALGRAPGIASPASEQWFRVELEDGPGLALGPGRYAFYLDADLAAGASGTSNGVRTVNPADPSTSDLFDPFFANSEITLFLGGSKGGAFGTTDPVNNLRAPREMAITYLGGSGERVRSAYEWWVEDHLPPGSSAAQALEDPDGDRIPNALEWSLGGHPLRAHSTERLEALGAGGDSDGENSWRFTRRAESAGPVALVLETSDDMRDWQRHPVPSTTDENFVISPDPSKEGFEVVLARLPAAQGAGIAFARLAMDAARVVAVDALHNDGPYLLMDGEDVRKIRVMPGPTGAIISDLTHEGGLAADTIAIYPDAGAPGDETKHAPFMVRLWDFPVEDEWDFEQPERIFAIADLECGFSETKTILLAGGVIDETLNWTYGDGHLVVNGDVFSRGSDMMALLWLIYKLDHDSRAAGGRVHLLMGNHEAMNLSGDERYVVPRYLETAAELGLEFKDLLGPETEIGRWLRTKNSVIRIGRNLFVHAGISPDFMSRGYTPLEANQLIRENLGLRTSQMEDRAEFLFRTFGPLWYRGMVSTREDHSPISTAQVGPILEHFDVDRVVVGHTKSNEIRHHRERLVVGIDVDHTGARARGDTRALRIERGEEGDVLRAIDDEGVAHEIPLRD